MTLQVMYFGSIGLDCVSHYLYVGVHWRLEGCAQVDGLLCYDGCMGALWWVEGLALIEDSWADRVGGAKGHI